MLIVPSLSRRHLRWQGRASVAGYMGERSSTSASPFISSCRRTVSDVKVDLLLEEALHHTLRIDLWLRI